MYEEINMTIGAFFWLLMILWLLFGLYWNRSDIRGGNYGIAGGNMMLFVLLFLLGWKLFGFPIQG
jgi:Na+/proline symporter